MNAALTSQSLLPRRLLAMDLATTSERVKWTALRGVSRSHN